MKIKVNRERVKCLDLRVEALVTARLKEGIDGLVRRVSWIVLIFSGTADRRLSAGHVGAAISHRRRLFSNFQKCPNTTIYSLSSLYICIHKFIDSQTYILCIYTLTSVEVWILAETKPEHCGPPTAALVVSV